METAPRNCRFLSLVVVELVLTSLARFFFTFFLCLKRCFGCFLLRFIFVIPPLRMQVVTDAHPPTTNYYNWGRGSGGVQSAGVSQSVRETGRDESQNVLSTQKALQNKRCGAPKFSGICPKLFAALRGVHPYFPVTNTNIV